MLVYCPDKYKTQRMHDEAVDDILAALRFIPDWFVKIMMIKYLFTVLYADDDKLYFNEDSGNTVLCCNEMGIVSIYLNNINLDNTNYDQDDPGTILHIKLLA